MQRIRFAWAAVVVVAGAPATFAADVVEFKVPAKLRDAVELPHPGQVQMGGWLGKRVANNATNRLAKVDLEPLLAGYRQRAGHASVDRRAHRQMAARRHAGLGQHRRSVAAREAGLRSRRN